MWTLYREDVSSECDCEDDDCPFHWLRWAVHEHEIATLFFRTQVEAEQFVQRIVPADQRLSWEPREVTNEEVALLASLWGSGRYYLQVEPTRYVLLRCSN